MKSKNIKWGTSLRRFPWSFKRELDPYETLTNNTLLEWYHAKHGVASDEEIKLLNSIEPNSCPYCFNRGISKYGFTTNRIRRYKCSNCNKTFTILTDTIFDSHKIPISEWFEFLLHLFEYHSIKTTSRDNKNSTSTGQYWLKKVFSVLEHYQDNIITRDNVYLDECFFSVKKKDTVLKDGKKLRGISKNKLCVASLYDFKSVLLLVEYTSKPSFKSTYNTLISRIKEGSTLIHDKEKTHSILVNKLKLKSIVFDSTSIKDLEDEDNPLYPINHIHSLVKSFMREHKGYNRDNLQDYMNLISFILNEPHNSYQKLIEFIKMAISTHERVKYRDVMKKKRPKLDAKHQHGAN